MCVGMDNVYVFGWGTGKAQLMEVSSPRDWNTGHRARNKSLYLLSYHAILTH